MGARTRSSAPVEPDIARIAAAIGDRGRAAMLTALLAGPPLPAGELAVRAGVAPSTASAHLARLVGDGLVARRRDGRHRYYELANAEVAAVLEALSRIAHADGVGASPDAELRFARTCYDHLAGRLGVLLTDTLIDRGLLTDHRGLDVTAAGEAWLSELEIDAPLLRRARRAFVRPCADWTERRDHMAGAVGAAVVDVFLRRRWITRLPETRAVRLTLRGRDALYRLLDLEID